jgi:hypothetical protein
MGKAREHKEGQVLYLATTGKPFYPQGPQGGLLTRPSDAIQGFLSEQVTVVVHGKERFMLSINRKDSQYFAWASPDDVSKYPFFKR